MSINSSFWCLWKKLKNNVCKGLTMWNIRFFIFTRQEKCFQWYLDNSNKNLFNKMTYNNQNRSGDLFIRPLSE